MRRSSTGTYSGSGVTWNTYAEKQNFTMTTYTFPDESTGVRETASPTWAGIGQAMDIFKVGAGIVGTGVDIVEAVTPPLIDEAFAAIDVIYALETSAFAGETYFGKPFPESGNMLVLGQDVVVTLADLGVGCLLELGNAKPPEGTAVSYVGDFITSGLSAVYDAQRIRGEIPTIFAVGIGISNWQLQISFLDYQYTEEYPEPEKIGERNW